MRTLTLALVAVLAGFPVVAMAATRLSPEQQIAKAVAGRTAGTPVACLNLRNIRSTRIIDRTAILYETSWGTIYVNRPTMGAQALTRDATLVTNTGTPLLCSVDMVRLYDTSLRMPGASIGLGKFTPYPKPTSGG